MRPRNHLRIGQLVMNRGPGNGPQVIPGWIPASIEHSWFVYYPPNRRDSEQLCFGDRVARLVARPSSVPLLRAAGKGFSKLCLRPFRSAPFRNGGSMHPSGAHATSPRLPIHGRAPGRRRAARSAAALALCRGNAPFRCCRRRRGAAPAGDRHRHSVKVATSTSRWWHAAV